MDSTGMGSFLFGIRQAEQHGKDMRFCCIQSRIQQLIRIAQLGEVISAYPNEEDAMKAFAREDTDD